MRNKNPLYLLIFFLIAACSSPRVEEEVLLSPQPVSTYSSAPEDQVLDEACRITINHFFSYRRGYDIEVLKSLFMPESQYLVENNKFFEREESLTILKIVPASKWWQSENLGTPTSKSILPGKENEYTYYVEFTGNIAANEDLVQPYPQSWIMFMFSDEPYSCKIKGYGW